MPDRKPKPGDRVIYRTALDEDMPGVIIRAGAGGIADILLDETSQEISGVEQNPAEDVVVSVSWRFMRREDVDEAAAEPAPMWVEALAAGAVMVGLDAGLGRFQLNRQGVQTALASFRRGVGLVIELPPTD